MGLHVRISNVKNYMLSKTLVFTKVSLFKQNIKYTKNSFLC